MNNLNQQELIKGLSNELFDVICKYEGSIYTSTIVGILEMLKTDMMQRGFKQTLEVMVSEQISKKGQV